jgi:hypothetical protein
MARLLCRLRLQLDQKAPRLATILPTSLLCGRRPQRHARQVEPVRLRVQDGRRPQVVAHAGHDHGLDVVRRRQEGWVLAEGCAPAKLRCLGGKARDGAAVFVAGNDTNNKCDIDNLASPDNVHYIPGTNTLVVCEDTTTGEGWLGWLAGWLAGPACSINSWRLELVHWCIPAHLRATSVRCLLHAPQPLGAHPPFPTCRPPERCGLALQRQDW